MVGVTYLPNDKKDLAKIITPIAALAVGAAGFACGVADKYFLPGAAFSAISGVGIGSLQEKIQFDNYMENCDYNIRGGDIVDIRQRISEENEWNSSKKAGILAASFTTGYLAGQHQPWI